MRTTTFPPLRVTPSLRRNAEAVLEAGETLSGFVLASIEQEIEARQARELFIERGLASGERARRTGKYVGADSVLRKLKRRLDAARTAVPSPSGKPIKRTA